MGSSSSRVIGPTDQNLQQIGEALYNTSTDHLAASNENINHDSARKTQSRWPGLRKDQSSGNNPIFTVAHTVLRNPAATQIIISHTPVQNTIPTNHKRCRLPGSKGSSVERIALDSTNIKLKFIVASRGQGILHSDFKHYSLPRIDLRECDNSDKFFSYAKMAWDMHSKGKEPTGVNCIWPGGKDKSLIPWNNVEMYERIMEDIRNAKLEETGKELVVDVYCVRYNDLTNTFHC